MGFKCACETGSTDHFTGTIMSVMNKADFAAMVEKIKQDKKVPVVLRNGLQATIDACPDGKWVADVRLSAGGHMSFGSDIFPQTEAWARERIGKPLHFVMIQLPKRGGFSMDVHDL